MNTNDMPVKAQMPYEYGEPPEKCKADCIKLAKGKTIRELQQISNYFSKCSSDLRNKVEETITMDSFEKAKKDHSDTASDGNTSDEDQDHSMRMK